jgi:glutathione S-transferase
MYRLFDSAISGNAYKVRLLLHKLDLPVERSEMDVDDGSTRQAEFLARNPVGQVPVLQLPDGTYLAQSNAILVYLAEGTRFWPADRLARARALQWMFFEQYNHEPTIAVVRHWVAHLGKTEATEPQLPAKIAGGYRALGIMEAHLAGRDFFVGDTLSVADIALYAYTHVADEGGFDLGRFPAIGTWLQRVADDPRHLRITD